MLIKTEPNVWRWLSTVHPHAGNCMVALSLIPVTVVLCVALWWRWQAWRRHPFSNNLKMFAVDPTNPDAWVAAASEINTQYKG